MYFFSSSELHPYGAYVPLLPCHHEPINEPEMTYQAKNIGLQLKSLKITVKLLKTFL